MKFSVEQKAFETELALALGCASQKEIAQKYLMQVSLEATDNGQLLIKTTNLETAYLSSIPADVEDAGSIMLDSKKLADHIASLTGDTVFVELKKTRVSIKCGKNTTRMNLFEGGELPAIPESPDPIAIVPIDTLAGLLNRVSFAVSTDDSRFTLTAALLKISEAGLTAVATDTKKLSLSEFAGSFESEASCLISKKVIAELSKIQSKSSGSDVEISADQKKNLFFRVGNRMLFALAIDGRFPAYAGCFMKGDRQDITLKSSVLKDTLDRVANFSDGQSTAVAFKLTENSLTISASTHTAGESEESIDIAYAGPEIEVGLSAKYVLEYLRVAGDNIIGITFFNPSAPVEFRVEGDPSWAVVIMPMNLA